MLADAEKADQAVIRVYEGLESEEGRSFFFSVSLFYN